MMTFSVRPYNLLLNNRIIIAIDYFEYEKIKQMSGAVALYLNLMLKITNQWPMEEGYEYSIE